MKMKAKLLTAIISSILLITGWCHLAEAKSNQGSSCTSTLGNTVSGGAIKGGNVQYMNNTWNCTTGVPSPMTNMVSEFPSALLDKIKTALPEGMKGYATKYMTDDLGANLFLKSAAKSVKISFITEGAGYTNAVGFFTFKKNIMGSLGLADFTDKVVFPNFSAVGSGGNLTLGDTVDLGAMQPSDGMGFTIFSNAWNGSSVVPTNFIYRSIAGFNPESTADHRAHTVLLSDSSEQVLILGFEDLNRDQGSDDDFNDAIIAIQVDPWSSVDLTHTVEITTGTVKADGSKGQLSWKEVTIPPEVADPAKTAKATARAAAKALKH